MILPIYAYGQPVLKKVAEPIDADYEGLAELVENMWETMYNAEGVGLAAPQIGKGIRLFVVDSKQMQEEGEEEKGLKQVFINAEKLDETGAPWGFEEGCLSIPDVRGEVQRPAELHIRFQDENFETHELTLTGMNARVVQHEYDHIEGKLFTEYLKPLKRRLIKRKLDNIKKGKITQRYRMRFKKS